MLSAMTLSMVLRNPGWQSSLMAMTVAGMGVLAGGRARLLVRRNAPLQLVAALTLAACAIPIELAAGRSAGVALGDFAGWSSVFVTFTLAVWACAARSSRVRRRRAGTWELLSILVPAFAAAGFLLARLRTQAVASAVAGLAAVALAVWRPGAKQMKAIGLSLAACAVVEAVVLALA